MVKRIKTKPHKPRIHGHRQNNSVQAWERGAMQRTLQEEARRRRMTRKDGETGEEYILARLALKNKDDVEEYRKGLGEAVRAVEVEASAQADAIRGFLQSWVDAGRLVPIPCQKKERPACRVYGGEKKRVVVMRQDDADAGPV